jgi:hypothetical protein
MAQYRARAAILEQPYASLDRFRDGQLPVVLDTAMRKFQSHFLNWAEESGA